MTTTDNPTHERLVDNAVAVPTTKKSRGRRGVPAPQAGTASPAIDALTGGDAPRIVLIPLDRLRAHPQNPRRDVGDVTELADSIRSHGVRQNLLVVPGPDYPGTYRLVIGHRRTAAARTVRTVTALPAVIDEDLSPAGQLELMLLENLQRTDLTPIEEADGYQGLLDLGHSEKVIAERLGRSRSTVKSRLRLRSLPEIAREAVHAHTATLEDAAAVVEIDDPTAREALAEQLGTKNFRAALTKVRQESTDLAKVTRLLKALDGVGAVEHRRDGYGAPDGSAELGSIRVQGVGAAQVDAGVDELLAGVVPGCSFRWWYGSLYVYRPMTLEQRQAAAQAAERRTAQDAEQAAREAAAAQRRAALQEFARLTATTRAEFLAGVVFERKALTAAQTSAMLAYTADTLIADAFADYGTSTRQPTYLRPAGTDLIPWTRIDLPTGYTDASFDWQRELLLSEPVTTAAERLTPPQRLLALAAAGAESSIDWTSWSAGHRSPPLVRWYGLLEQLGYVPSDDERAALTPPTDTAAQA